MNFQNLILDASIIVSTKNRASALSNLMQSLSDLDISDIRFEVIVVDNGSKDNTRSIVEEWCNILPIRYVYVAQPGLSRARNAGIYISRGQFILMTDDDCIVDRDWLTSSLSFLKENPNKLIGGYVRLFDPNDLPITIITDTEPRVLPNSSDIFGFMHGCNMIFGRCILQTIGNFDICLGPGTPTKAAEDTDFIYRAYRKGIPVCYEPSIRISHNHGRKLVSDGAKLEKGYKIGFGAMSCKYLLRGDLSLIKLCYWILRSDMRRNRNIFVKDSYSFLCGSFRYVLSRIKYRKFHDV